MSSRRSLPRSGGSCTTAKYRFIPPSVIGASLVGRTIGFVETKWSGPSNGPIRGLRLRRPTIVKVWTNITRRSWPQLRRRKAGGLVCGARFSDELPRSFGAPWRAGLYSLPLTEPPYRSRTRDWRLGRSVTIPRAVDLVPLAGGSRPRVPLAAALC
jgi:hypothetical protein